MRLLPFQMNGIAVVTLALVASARSQDILLVPEQYLTIQDAMDAASPGDVIDLAAGTWTNQRVWGLQDVTLRGRAEGGEVIIDGSKQGWSPVVCFGTSVIENITFRNGVGSNVFGIVRGGAIYSEFASITIRECRFQQNAVRMKNFDSDAIGGAVCCYSGGLTIENCEFEGNASDRNGGAISIQYGTNLEITGCRFIDNSANEKGGAIDIRRTPSSINVSLLQENSAGYLGGGIHAFGDQNGPKSTPGSIANCTFRRNAASEFGFGMGGGIAIEGYQSVNVVDSAFEDNYGYISGAIMAGSLGAPGTAEISGNHFCGNALNTLSGNITDAGGNTEESSCRCSPDINLDGRVNAADLGLLLVAWGGWYPPADINNDGTIDGADLAQLLVAWDRDCGDD